MSSVSSRLSIAVLFLVLGCSSDSPVTPDPDPGPVDGQIVLDPDRDNSLFEDPAGALSNGKGQFLFAGITKDTLSRRALVRFDVAGASIPSDATIDSVHFELRMDRTIVGNTAVTVHRVTADWGEGASDAPFAEGTGAPSEDGDVTWIHRFFNGPLWATPGGDFVAQPSATATVGDEVRVYVWRGSQLLQDVLGWRSAPQDNFGWMVIGEEGNDITAKRFGSREDIPANRPKLRVFFSS